MDCMGIMASSWVLQNVAFASKGKQNAGIITKVIFDRCKSIIERQLRGKTVGTTEEDFLAGNMPVKLTITPERFLHVPIWVKAMIRLVNPEKKGGPDTLQVFVKYRPLKWKPSILRNFHALLSNSIRHEIDHRSVLHERGWENVLQEYQRAYKNFPVKGPNAGEAPTTEDFERMMMSPMEMRAYISGISFEAKRKGITFDQALMDYMKGLLSAEGALEHPAIQRVMQAYRNEYQQQTLKQYHKTIPVHAINWLSFKCVFSSKEEMYSWLSPTGQFFPVDRNGTHSEAAWLRFPPKPGDTKPDPLATAWQAGWYRITYMGGTLYAHNDLVPPNPSQKKALEDLAIEQHMEDVQIDHNGDLSTIWSYQDAT